MMKRLLLALIAVLAVALVGCSAAPAPSTAATSPTIGLSYIPNVQFSPFYAAMADGSYTKAGVTPTLRHHGTSEGLFTALTTGGEQFVVAGGDEVLQARSQGMNLVTVAAYYHDYPVQVIVANGSPITTLADLKGHTIGLPGKYGESWFALLVALKSAGLTEADVTIKEIGYTQVAALSTGKVDAIVGFSNNDAVQFGLAGTPIRSIPIATGTVPLVSASLVTTADYAAAHPDVVKAVVAGTLAGVSSVVADQNHALAVSASYVPDLGTPAGAKAAQATLAATVPLWTINGAVSGKLDAAQWAAMADFMAQQGLTPTRQDPNLAMSNAFN
ncbi:MAG: ABC transporter substrate-binding protein [Propionibacteriales bacterium]|nr:ABC transporter substrate-binding protein [Propionibacteriales bacterium]